jgi:hypothetical protein
VEGSFKPSGSIKYCEILEQLHNWHPNDKGAQLRGVSFETVIPAKYHHRILDTQSLACSDKFIVELSDG